MAEAQQISQTTLVILYISGAILIYWRIRPHKTLTTWGLTGCSFALVGVYILYVAATYSLKVLASLIPRTGPRKSSSGVHEDAPASTSTIPHKREAKDLKTLIKESQAAKNKKHSTKDEAASHHPLFLNTLKGHGDVVTAVSWSADGTTLATACDDACVRVFDISNITNKEPKFKRLNLARTPVGVALGATPTQVVVLLHDIPDVATLAEYEFKQKKTGPITDAPGWEVVWQVEHVHGKEAPMVLHSVPTAASVGRMGLLVSLSKKKDARIFSMQGRQMALLEVNSLANHGLAVSQDGRFVAVVSFTADTKVWEVKFSRTGEYIGTEKVMDLKGHSSQVMAISFSPDNKRAVTASKDGTLRVWNLDVRYAQQEDAKCLLKVPLPLPTGKCYQHLAYGPNGIVAAAFGGRLHFLEASSGKVLEDVDAHDADITAMHWAPAPRQVLATSSKDKRVRLWQAPS